MRVKDFIRLPLGKYNLKDQFYNYVLDKCLTNDGRVMYSIRDKQGGGYLSLFEEKEEITYEDRHGRERNTGYHTIILSACTSVGGISLHTRNTFWAIRNLKVVPKSSFKQYLQKLEQQLQLA